MENGKKSDLLKRDLNKRISASRPRRFRLDEAEVWYRGNSDELLNFYYRVNRQFSSDDDGGGMIPIFANSKNYFWAISSREYDFKRTHSGLPNAIVSLLANSLGTPVVKISKMVPQDPDEDDVKEAIENGCEIPRKNYEKAKDYYKTLRINDILKQINFWTNYSRKFVPYTLVLGDGAYFPTMAQGDDHPGVVFYDARNVDFDYTGSSITAVTARRYYTIRPTFDDPERKPNDYVLYERRGTKMLSDGSTAATISYKLYTLADRTRLTLGEEVPLTDIKETAGLKDIVLPGFDRMLAVPVMWGEDAETRRGMPIFYNKMDLLDDLDQSLSQRSSTCRRSTPIDYISEDVLDYDDDGKPVMPHTYDRRFLVTKHSRNALSDASNKPIETSQPQLNFDQYNAEALELTMEICSGIVSPASLGLMLARNDTAISQREKEKTTLFTRKTVIDNDKRALSNLFDLLLDLDDFAKAKNPEDFANKEYTVNIDYPEYANPSFDAVMQSLQGAFASGMISPEQLVNKVWGDNLSDEERENEIEYLKEQKKSSVVPDEDTDPFGPTTYDDMTQPLGAIPDAGKTNG